MSWSVWKAFAGWQTLNILLLYALLYCEQYIHVSTGLGDKKDIIVEAVPCEDLFVNVSGASVTLENITFVQVLYSLLISIKL